MITIEATEKVNKKEWNDLVCSVPEGTVFQTAYWADYLSGSGYGRPFFFMAKEDGQCKGILLLWIERLTARTRPDNKILACGEILSKGLRLAYGTWMYGPIVFDKSRGAEINDLFLREIDDFARKERLVFARSLGEPVFYNLQQPSYGGPDCYAGHGFDSKVKGTLFIDLSKDIDNLWMGLKKYTRKDVKNCDKYNLEVGFLEEGRLGEYHHLVEENMGRVGAETPPHFPDKHMWNALNGGSRRCLEVMTVKKDGMMIGAVGILEFNGVIFQMGSCQSDDSYYKKINVNDLMTWEIIKLGVTNKNRFYDLSGIPVEPANKKEEGLLNFKMKWSGSRIGFNSYEKTYRHITKSALNIVRRLIA